MTFRTGHLNLHFSISDVDFILGLIWRGYTTAGAAAVFSTELFKITQSEVVALLVENGVNPSRGRAA